MPDIDNNKGAISISHFVFYCGLRKWTQHLQQLLTKPSSIYRKISHCHQITVFRMMRFLMLFKNICLNWQKLKSVYSNQESMGISLFRLHGKIEDYAEIKIESSGMKN